MANNNKDKNLYINKFTKEPVSTYSPTAFQKIRTQFGLDPAENRTSNAEKLEQQRERFLKKQNCPVCGSKKTYIKNTNVMVCTNPDCKGFVRKDEDGKVVSYTPPFSELTVKGEAVASSILD